MSKLVVSKYIETSADGEKLIFEVDDELTETTNSEAPSEEPVPVEPGKQNTDGE